VLGVPVGDRVRVVVGRAVKGPIVLAVGFVVFIVTAKDVPALYVHEPWQDDPYDAVISFAFLGVPLLTGLSALRVEMCRRAEALPARRVLDLLRLSRVLIAVIALTLGSEWVSVALGVHGEAWTPVTNIVLAVLAALSALTVAAGWQLRRASRACGRTPAPQQPDWLADAAALAKRELTGLGSWGTRFAPVLDWWIGRSSTACGGHPRWFAAAFSVLGAVAAGSPQVVLEGYGPPLAVFLVAAACSLFAFVVLVGPYLRLVGRGGTQRPAASLAVPLSATRSCVVAPIAPATCARVVETAQKTPLRGQRCGPGR